MTADGDIAIDRRPSGRRAAATVALSAVVLGVLGAAGAAQAAPAALAAKPAPRPSSAPPPPPAPPPATRAQQWYLNHFEMDAVWRISRGNGVTVAIVGSGVDVGQPDIAGSSLAQVDFSTGSPKPGPGDVSPNNDGTAAALLIAGSGLDQSGIEGIAPMAKLLPLRYYGGGNDAPSPAYAALAIRYAADHGSRVILMPLPAPYDTTSLTDAVGYALGKGALVITSASDNGRTSDQMTAPCTVPGAVCVSGTTQDGTVWKDSSIGPPVTLGAPAQALPVWQQDKYAIHSGTRFAAALVAGEAALVLGAHLTWTAGQVISAMIDTATGGNAAHTRVNDKVGYGIMNPGGAVGAARPASLGNPLLATGAGTSGAAPSGAASARAGARSGASQGSWLPWLLIGVGAAVVVLGGLVIVAVVRRRGGGGRNYVSDPAYQAMPYYSTPVRDPYPYGASPTAEQGQAEERDTGDDSQRVHRGD